MTETLPEPKSRKESYLAKAAGMDVTVPEEPRSRLEQYLNAIAEGGGGGGGTSDFDQLTNRPKYKGVPMTGETNIPESTTYTAGDGIDIVAGVIKATNTGKARELTTADYNWNSTTNTATEPYDCIAAWLLDDGKYHYDGTSVVIKVFKNDSTFLGQYPEFTVVSGGSRKTIYAYGNGENISIRQYVINEQSGYEGNKVRSASLVKDSAIVQTTGTSTSDVMSQDAVTRMVYADPATRYRIAIGSSSSTIGTAGTAIGLNAQVSNGADGGVAIGVHARAGQRGEMNIGVNSSTDAPYYGYNGSQYRLLTGLYDPQSAHDAATKGYVDGKILSGAGAPTTSTTGTVGQVYQDTTNGKLYICTAVTPGTDPDPDTYTWTEVGAGSGGSGVKVLSSSDYNYPTNNPDGIALWLLEPGMYIQPSSAVYVYANNEGFLSSSVSGSFIVGNTKDGKKKILAFGAASDSTALLYSTAVSDGTKDYVRHLIDEDRIVQSTGTATDFVMSQNAVTSMVFQDPSNRGRIRIGGYASSGNEDGIAIGKVASLNAAKSIAIGASASATGQESIALGDGSSATQKGQMDIGAAGTTYGGYNNSNYRLLTGLYDGQSAHDAVNLGQLQNAIINGGTSAPTTTTVGAVGTQYTYVDTTGTPTAHLCVCTEIDTTDPSNPVYTWSTLI